MNGAGYHDDSPAIHGQNRACSELSMPNSHEHKVRNGIGHEAYGSEMLGMVVDPAKSTK
jgi:hypothetical protein